MKIRDKTNKIVENIRKINQMIHMKHHEVAQQYNLSLDQFHLLVHLDYKKENPTIGDIAKKSNRSQNTISERVTRLEEKGLLMRVSDKIDRRVSRVIVTDKGKELIESVNYEASNEFVFKALCKVEDEISTTLLKGLELLAKNLEVEKEDIND